MIDILLEHLHSYLFLDEQELPNQLVGLLVLCLCSLGLELPHHFLPECAQYLCFSPSSLKLLTHLLLYFCEFLVCNYYLFF